MGAFLSPLGLPCQAPPWGYVSGADLTTGKIFYRHVNGTVRDLSPIPLPFKMGVPGIGGPIITKGGVAFLSGTLDNFARAYDVTSGKQLWKSRLPAGGQATPMTYWSEQAGASSSLWSPVAMARRVPKRATLSLPTRYPNHDPVHLVIATGWLPDTSVGAKRRSQMNAGLNPIARLRSLYFARR